MGQRPPPIIPFDYYLVAQQTRMWPAMSYFLLVKLYGIPLTFVSSNTGTNPVITSQSNDTEGAATDKLMVVSTPGFRVYR